MMYQYFKITKFNWQLLLRERSFRYKLFIGIFLIAVILICFPYFFQYIEQRNGAALSDGVLDIVPPYDVSALIFILIWNSSFFMLLTLFLMYLCQSNRVLRYYTMIASILIAILVLVQHIHYTIDVLFAFPFAYACFITSKKLININPCYINY